jgi:hypothetical protein
MSFVGMIMDFGSNKKKESYNTHTVLCLSVIIIFEGDTYCIRMSNYKYGMIIITLVN